ncbi:protein CIP2A homolog [Hetaerina americana]|uniref:protein CIP2A homolog n=1 Tax=Hetaerina americana TaxID=62018 RepID=UPI003A7F1F49
MEKLIVSHKEIQDNHDSMIVQKEEENSRMKGENSSLKFELGVLQKKVQELEETLQDGYIECATLTETVTNLEKELNDKNQLYAQMELEITQLKEENEVSDNLLQEVNRNLEIKEGLILELEKELQVNIMTYYFKYYNENEN